MMMSNDIPSCAIIHGDSRKVLFDVGVQADLIVTSPPYADARKGHYDSVSPDDYPEWLSSFHAAFWHALKPDGSLIINIKDKVVNGVRHRYVWRTIERFAELGWYCIDDYMWIKKNAFPGRWPNRLKDAWEYCFHLAKTKRPYFNSAVVATPLLSSTQTRLSNLKSNAAQRINSATGSGFSKKMAGFLGRDKALPSNVLQLAVESRNQCHPAAFPVGLPRFFIQLLSPPQGFIIDPFSGSGTVGVAALELGRKCLLIDNHAYYCQVAKQRLQTL